MVVLVDRTQTSPAEGCSEVLLGCNPSGRSVLDCHLVLAGSAVCVVARNVLQVVHRVRPSRGKGLTLGGAALVVDRQRVVRVGTGTRLRVHFGHLVAVHDWRDGHQHVCMGHGPGHCLLPELVTSHGRRQQQGFLGVEAVSRQQLLVRQVATTAVGVGCHCAVGRQAIVPTPWRPGRGQDVILGHGPLDSTGALALLVVLVVEFVTQFDHVGGSLAGKVRMEMFPGVVVVQILIVCRKPGDTNSKRLQCAAMSVGS